jgi:hypothetical protein
LIYGIKIDYLVFDYLSEITMSLLIAAKHKQKVSVCSYTAFSVFTANIKVHLTRSMNQFKIGDAKHNLDYHCQIVFDSLLCCGFLMLRSTIFQLNCACQFH